MGEVARLDFESVERPYITVNIGGEERQLPLTFNSSDLDLMGQHVEAGEGMVAFVAKYLGDVTYQLGDNQLMAVLRTWNKCREPLMEPDVGESSASPE